MLMFTKDNSFIIKTIKKSEFLFLQKNIFEYSKYINSQSTKTTLVKIFGLYSIKFDKKYFYFIIMNNLFGSMKMNYTFDLKGSKEGRFAKQGENLLKDLDVLEKNFKLYFNKQDEINFVNQLTLDIQFLNDKFNVMDYSLLLGNKFK
jgi:hypothetical protein